ncbi:MAG: glycoside hydrolase family 28 protein [Nibricoccus sp.]
MRPLSFFHRHLPLLISGLCLALTLRAAPAGTFFNIRDYGAVGDGKALETAAFAKAVDACVAQGGGTVYVPPGRYLTGTVQLKSHVTLHVEGGATILGSKDPADYPDTKSVWGDDTLMIAPLIYATDAENVTITGRGTIDGQGKIWWKRLELASPNPKRGWPAPSTPAEHAEVAKISRARPRLIRLVRCRDVLIEHVNLCNAADWTVHPMLCEFVRVDGISIHADPESHNTDGINPEACSNVHIANCRIDTGDDCVTLKSGINELGRRMGKPTENVTITNCVMYRGHGGVTIGSEMSGGIRNIAVTNCVFQGTDNGIRIKSQRGRGGLIEGLVVSNIVMHDVPTPFIITTFYAGKDKVSDEHPVDEGTPAYRDFHFNNITVRGAKIAGAITGLREKAIENITFNQVQIQSETGFAITNARDVIFTDTLIVPAKGPAVLLDNATAIDTAGIRTRNGTPVLTGPAKP